MQAKCRHCSLTIPAYRRESGFCCVGCEAVYHTLHNLGLEEFYRYRDIGSRSAQQPSPSQSSYAYLDTPVVTTKLAAAATGRRVCLYLEGIHCAGCVWLIERLPKLLPGLSQSTVDFAASEVSITFDPNRVKLSAIAQMLDSFGYRVHLLEGMNRENIDRKESRTFLWRLGVAGFVWGNTMMLAVSLYQGMVTGIDQPYADYFRWVSFFLTLPAVTYSAWPFYRTSVAALRAKSLHIDVPITIGILVAFAFSTINTALGREEVYFDSVTGLIFLLLTGRWLQSRATRRAQRLSERSFTLLPATARTVTNLDADAVREDVPARYVQSGALVEVLPGERIPVDGTVAGGESLVDESVLTGESVPLRVMEGQTAFAGTMNLERRIVLRALGGSDVSRVGRLVAQVKSQSRRAPVVLLTDKLSRYFVFTVLVLAVCTAALWWSSGPSVAFTHAVALLVITCPCALGLATPIAMTVALGKAASRGLLIKGEEAIERLARTEQIFFDKTGTLTEGILSVADVWTDLDPGLLRSRLLSLASIAPHHPLSRSLLEHLGETAAPSEGAHVPGCGVVDQLSEWRLGSERWLEKEIEALPWEAEARLSAWRRGGYTVLLLLQGRSLRALVALLDGMRADAKQTVESLKAIGLYCFILSGDGDERVARVAGELGIDGKGSLYPEEKEAWVKKEPRFSAVVGDGFNDALAMKAAGVSIGVRGGLEANIEVADVFAGGHGLRGVIEVLSGARETMRVIRRNLAISLVYNVVGGAAAMLGWVNPLVAAVLMPLSSLSVIWSSVHTKAFDEEVVP